MTNKNIFEETGISLDQLRAKQSVRTTFKLPTEVISLLSVVSGQLGIKQKSLIDQLTEDIALLKRIARTAEKAPKRHPSCQQKTFVMSKSALQAINEVAEKSGIPRDVLLELSIRRLMPVVSQEQEKHEKRVKILHEMYTYIKDKENFYNQCVQLLGEDDEVSMMIAAELRLAHKNIQYGELLLKKGRALEEW